MDKVHAAMRWILADGAGALVLQAGPNGKSGREIIGTFVESVGVGRPAGMTAGKGAAELMKASHQMPEAYGEGSHHLWQDFSAVNNDAAPLLLEGLCKFTKQLEIDPGMVDHYVASIPTLMFYEDFILAFLDRLNIDRDRLKFRGDRSGYCGGAATLVHFDEMVRSGELKSGQLAIVHAVESSKWMTAGFAVRW
jgi:3-oxoacyl-[acyl-carrier-protein] synthase III